MIHYNIYTWCVSSGSGAQLGYVPSCFCKLCYVKKDTKASRVISYISYPSHFYQVSESATLGYIHLCCVLLQISAYERSPPHYYQHYIDELFPRKLVILCY